MAWWRSLTVKIFFMLAAGLLTLQTLSYGIVSTSLEGQTRERMFNFMVADIGYVHSLLRPLDDTQRRVTVAKLNRGFYNLAIVTPSARAKPVAPGLFPFLDRVGINVDRLVAAPRSRWIWANKSGEQVPVLEVPLSRGQALEIDARDPLPRLSGMALILYMAALFVLVATFTLVAIRLVMRPLQRFSEAALKLGADLDTPLDVSNEPTEVRNAAVALNSLRTQVLRKIADNTQTLAAVSHDLQTPITRMLLRADGIRDDLIRTKIVADLEFMSALVVQALEYGRSMEMHDRMVMIDLDALIGGLVDEMIFVGQKVTVMGSVGCPVPGAPRGLQRVFQNLLGNAAKYARNIDVRLSSDNGVAMVSIIDDGPGIPQEHMDEIRRPFARLEGSRSRDSGGTGLGLAIVDNILRGHDGRMDMRNRTHGLEVTVILPCKARV